MAHSKELPHSIGSVDKYFTVAEVEMAPENTCALSDTLYEALLAVAELPFGTVGDYSTLDGVKVSTRRSEMLALVKAGLVGRHSFGATELPAANRFWATSAGYESQRLRAGDDTQLEWHAEQQAALATMSARPDVAAIIARVAANFTTGVGTPSPWYVYYYRTGPLDCVVDLSGHAIGVLWMGPSQSRTRILERLSELRTMCDGRPPHVVVVVPTAYDHDVIDVAPGAREMSITILTPREVAAGDFSHPSDEETLGLVASSPPITDLPLQSVEPRRTPVRPFGHHPALHLSPQVKKLIDLLVHWPLTPRSHLVEMMGIHGRSGNSQFSQLLARLRKYDFLRLVDVVGTPGLALSDAALSHVGVRDRRDVTALKSRLSVENLPQLLGGALPSQSAADAESSRIAVYFHQPRHERIITEVIGYLCRSAHAMPGYAVDHFLPSPESLYHGEQWSEDKMIRALVDWRVLPTNRDPVDDVVATLPIDIYPDALVEITYPGDYHTVMLEVELTARSERQWQDRLERYILLATSAYDLRVPAIVVESETSVRRVLAATSRWKRLDASGRRFSPVAIATLSDVRANADQLLHAPIWHFDDDFPAAPILELTWHLFNLSDSEFFTPMS